MAVKHYNESIKRNPKDPRVYSNRAACYTKLAEFGMALKDVDECLKLDDKFLKAYLRKGAICITIKETLKAQHAFEKALELDPNCQVGFMPYRILPLNVSTLTTMYMS